MVTLCGLRTALLTLLSSLVLALPASANVIWDEDTTGDLSSDPSAPTRITLGLGSNIIAGTVVTDTDVRDYVTFTLASGQALGSLLLLEYLDVPGGGPADRGFHAINAGSTSVIPGPSSADFFLGGAHLNAAPAGTDLLPGLADGIAGSGFSIPLGPGTYTYLVQQIGPEKIGYRLDLVVIPEPSTALLVGAGLCLLGNGRRRE